MMSNALGIGAGPEAFAGMLGGKNVGKAVLRISANEGKNIESAD